MRTRSASLVTSVVAGIALALAPAGAAHAATTVGTTTPGTISCSNGAIYWGTSGTDVVQSAGIVTSLSLHSTSTTGFNIAVVVVRGTTVIGTTPSTPSSASGTTTVSGLTIRVQPGDALGIWSDTGVSCAVAGPASEGWAAALSGAPTQGETLTAGASGTGNTFTVSGSIEGDVDGDGYGDETEDACPADASRHLAPCTVDIGVTASPLLGSIGVGDLGVIDLSISNPATGPATGTAVTLTPSAGLQVVQASVPCTLGTSPQCDVGTLPANTTQHVLVVVKGTALGAQLVTVGLTSTTADPNPANNTANAALSVLKRVTVQCVVPKLAGLNRSAAAKALTAKGCALGKVTTKASATKKGKVLAQAKKPGAKLAYGTKVNVTLGK